MLKFIKKLFQKEEVEVVLPKQRVKLEHLDSWFEKHTAKNTKSVIDQTAPLLSAIDDAVFAASENLKKLERAELRNKKISARELTIMKGNRDSYIQRIGQFLGTLRVLHERQDLTYADVKSYYDEYMRQIAVINKALRKPYAVLQHFFSNESYAVAQQMKAIDVAMQKLGNLLSSESREAQLDCRKQIAALEDFRDKDAKLRSVKREAEDDVVRLQTLVAQAKEKVARVESSENYGKYQELLKKQKEHERAIATHSADFIHSFATLEKALKKYVKMRPEQQLLIDAYIKDPVHALHDDTSFTISSVLEVLKKSIDALDLKEGKRTKTLAAIDQLLAQDYLASFLAKDKALFEKKHQFARNAKQHTALQQHKEAQYMLQTYEEKLAATKEKLTATEEEIAQVNLAVRKEQLEKDLHRCTQFEVEILL